MGSQKLYFRPLLQTGPAKTGAAFQLAGGWCWFDSVEIMRRGGSTSVVAAQEIPAEILSALTASRADCCDLSMDRPRIMGIVNVTPDSFSDGGSFLAADAGIAHGRKLVSDGADILDIGGESTRPGAETVEIDDECDRVVPVIEGLLRACDNIPISIDTRKAPVARAALKAGAGLINDVTAFGYDPDMAPVAAQSGAEVCLMHIQGDPATMQLNPQYEDVVLDVYDALEAAVQRAEASGIERKNIIVDPGIGFGKTTDHNLALLARLSIFHTLGCKVLLGASRKRFIGEIGGVADAQARVSGSVAVALHAVAQGCQIIRVHDVAETRQALALWEEIGETR